MPSLGRAKPAGPDRDRLLARGLTPREAAVLGSVAHASARTGTSPRSSVSSERTIGKHLQRCYRKLGAVSRSHAAAIAWDLTP